MDGEAARQRGALADRQEEAPVFLCGRCTGEIYADEFVFLWENRRVCVDCFQGAVNAWAKEAPLEVAEELGVKIETA